MRRLLAGAGESGRHWMTTTTAGGGESAFVLLGVAGAVVLRVRRRVSWNEGRAKRTRGKVPCSSRLKTTERKARRGKAGREKISYTVDGEGKGERHTPQPVVPCSHRERRRIAVSTRFVSLFSASPPESESRKVKKANSRSPVFGPLSSPVSFHNFICPPGNFAPFKPLLHSSLFHLSSKASHTHGREKEEERE